MANNYWKEFPEGKNTTAPSYKARAGGGTPNMPRKQSFTSMSLPGKASDNFAAAKRGFKEVNGYAAYKGLSECPMGGKKRMNKKMKKDMTHEMMEY